MTTCGQDCGQLFCKPQDTVDPTLSKLSKESFILAIQTKFQRDLYISNMLRLFCTTVIEVFLHEIHQRSPNAGVKTIMTDDDIYITYVMHTKIMSVLLDNADGLLLSEYVDVILDTFFIDGILIN